MRIIITLNKITKVPNNNHYREFSFKVILQMKHTSSLRIFQINRHNPTLTVFYLLVRLYLRVILLQTSAGLFDYPHKLVGFLFLYDGLISAPLPRYR